MKIKIDSTFKEIELLEIAKTISKILATNIDPKCVYNILKLFQEQIYKGRKVIGDDNSLDKFYSSKTFRDAIFKINTPINYALNRISNNHSQYQDFDKKIYNLLGIISKQIQEHLDA